MSIYQIKKFHVNSILNSYEEKINSSKDSSKKIPGEYKSKDYRTENKLSLTKVLNTQESFHTHRPTEKITPAIFNIRNTSDALETSSSSNSGLNPFREVNESTNNLRNVICDPGTSTCNQLFETNPVNELTIGLSESKHVHVIFNDKVCAVSIQRNSDKKDKHVKGNRETISNTRNKYNGESKRGKHIDSYRESLNDKHIKDKREPISGIHVKGKREPLSSKHIQSKKEPIGGKHISSYREHISGKNIKSNTEHISDTHNIRGKRETSNEIGRFKESSYGLKNQKDTTIYSFTELPIGKEEKTSESLKEFQVIEDDQLMILDEGRDENGRNVCRFGCPYKNCGEKLKISDVYTPEGNLATNDEYDLFLTAEEDSISECETPHSDEIEAIKRSILDPLYIASMSKKSRKPWESPPHTDIRDVFRTPPQSYRTGTESSRDKQYLARQRLCKYVRDDIIGGEHVFKGPWGITPIIYVDYVASAKALHCIEDYIQDHVLPMYANTHTEVSITAQQTQMFRDEARAIIKQSVNATEDDAVIFTGSGSTSATNKLVSVLLPGKGHNPLILLGPFEHHSNILPWMQVPGAKVTRIRSTNEGLLDLDHLIAELQKESGCFRKKRKLIIGSFSAGSNVTGILVDVNAVCAIMHKYDGYAFFDYACVAPYVNIDMNPNIFTDKKNDLTYKDAIMISTHKFLGGPGTPGLLIAKRHCFRNQVPHNVGGGTVQFVRRASVNYRLEIEEREEGGTPAIIESIRAGLVFKLKETFTAAFIMTREEELLRKAKDSWQPVKNLIILGNLNVRRLPIFPIMIYNPQTGLFLHHDFVAMVLNDVFGLQVRSGCACAGPYSMDLLSLSESIAREYEDTTVWKPTKSSEQQKPIAVLKPGFARLNLPYFFSDESFNFVLKAVEMIADNAWKLLYLYEFDPYKGTWSLNKGYPTPNNKKHLFDVTFESGRMEIVEGLHKRYIHPSHLLEGGSLVDVDSLAVLTKSDTDLNKKPAKRQQNEEKRLKFPLLINQDCQGYSDVLKRAQKILTPSRESIQFHAKLKQEKSPILKNRLRWFMLPEESLTLLSGGTVEYCPPRKLPFLPHALAVKLGMIPADKTNKNSRKPSGMELMLKYKTVTPDISSVALESHPTVPWSNHRI